MGMYLNSITPFENYKRTVANTYFVDKSMLIEELMVSMESDLKYICITRPRRFGKTVMANMVSSFFSKSVDARSVFLKLQISQGEDFEKYLNQYTVIFIDFSEIPENCSTYEEYISRIIKRLKSDLCEEYKSLPLDYNKAVWDILTEIFEKKEGQKFIFVLDEWDAVFHMSFITEQNKADYLLFLKSLLKSKAYVELAYMTGILPITKYSGGWELNMFIEYNMATKARFSEYFGFTDREVDDLYERYQLKVRKPRITREDLRVWYDGYHTVDGERIYNPRSVDCTLSDNQLSNYWTNSGPYDEIFFYIKNKDHDGDIGFCP